jgi:HEAT repeat protein
MLSDSDATVRASGAHAFSIFEERAAPDFDALHALLGDRSPLVRTYAAVALGAIGKQAAPALPQLMAMQKERDYRVSGAARKAVHQIKGLPSPARMLGAYR